MVDGDRAHEGEVVVLRRDDRMMTPEQALAGALGRARRGEVSQVYLVEADSAGRLHLSWSEATTAQLGQAARWFQLQADLTLDSEQCPDYDLDPEDGV